MEQFKSTGQSNNIQELLDEAQEQGYVTLDQILDAFPEAEDDLAQLENLFDQLYDEGVDVYDDEVRHESRAETREAGSKIV